MDRVRKVMISGQPVDARPVAAALGGRSVVLVGMMGAGKTSVGKRLAAKLGLPFVDADAEIEAGAQLTILEIFERFGEAYFREGERKVIARLLNSGPQVLATGGGAFMNKSNSRHHRGARRLDLAETGRRGSSGARSQEIQPAVTPNRRSGEDTPAPPGRALVHLRPCRHHDRVP